MISPSPSPTNHQVAEKTSGELDLQNLRWQPLDLRSKRRYLSMEETTELLRGERGMFLHAVDIFATHGSKEAARDGLRLLSTLPIDDVLCLYGVVGLYTSLLKQLGRESEAYQLQFKQLFELQSEELWLRRGMLCVVWLHNNRDTSDYQKVLLSLGDVCKRSNLVVPNLIYADQLWMRNQIAESMTYYDKALKPNAWSQFPNLVSDWLVEISKGIYRTIKYWFEQGHEKRASSYARTILGFSWEQIESEYAIQQLQVLCLCLESLNRWSDIERLCAKMSESLPSLTLRHYWLGRTAQAKAQINMALAHFRAAITHQQELSNVELPHILRFFFVHNYLEDINKILENYTDKDTPEYLQFLLMYTLVIGDHDKALMLSDQLEITVPDNYSAKIGRLLLLESMQRYEQCKAELLALLKGQAQTQEELLMRHFGLLLLGLLEAQEGDVRSALLRFSQLPGGEFLFANLMSDKELQRRYCETRGNCLREIDDFDTALYWFRKALTYDKNLGIYHKISIILTRTGRFEEAESIVKEGLDLYPDSFELQFSKFLLLEHFARWEEASQCLEDIGLERFREKGLLKEGLFMWIRHLAYRGKILEALVFTESFMAEILVDEDLKNLRHNLLQQVIAIYQQMQNMIGEQQHQIDQMAQKHQHLWQKLEQGRSKEDRLQDVLEHQQKLQHQLEITQQREKSLRLQLQQTELPKPKPDTLHASQVPLAITLPTIYSDLPDSMRQILYSAEVLWHKLSTDAAQDHGPVVLQLARVIEGEINRLFIDQLVAFALERNYKLSDFPTIALGHLKTMGNRLSLGDAANLIYHQITIEHPHGHWEYLRNPLSNDVHRHIIEQFWQQPHLQSLAKHHKIFLHTELPGALQKLSKVRNRASHAGQIIIRSEAGEVRELVLGNDKFELGWLAHILSLEPNRYK